MIKAVIVHQDVSKCIQISMELFCIAQLLTWLFEVTHNWMKLLQIAKFDLADRLYPNVYNVCKCFQFHPYLYKAFLICPDIIEVVGP